MSDKTRSLLCIEASSDRQDKYRTLAASAGLAFVGTQKEADALTHLEAIDPFTVLVIGQEVTEGDPLQIIEHSRSSPIHASVPIAFVMNERDVELARSAMDAGATEVFLATEENELNEFVCDCARSAALPTYSGKALLVEDDEIHAEYVTVLCTSLGFEVICVDDAEHAIEALKRDAFHLLITDVVLRGTKTGIALIRQLRHELGIQIPVIVMSGFDDLPRRLLALRNGVGDFVAKPFAPEEFIWRVQRVLQLMALSDQSALGDSTAEDTQRIEQFETLSPREYEICLDVLKGKSDKEIAAKLGISYWTVRSHVQQIFSKTGAINRRELMARYISKKQHN